ncbi:hypothetical protein JRF84_25045 [Methylobacterium organophilum]|uniref:hypothetical protein n=1 Tax=Methylobacterium organophilum TaxID=410 RepID=UPI0019D079BA|nr:hypothetical protein [Methylobacterium organophilum]MBN6822835.1 hypothetical protein [Methylobacterium organophilum]
MTPDLKRLCEAADAAGRAKGYKAWSHENYEFAVRAVLDALRKPSDDLREAMSDATPFAEQALNEMADFILAEPAKA